MIPQIDYMLQLNKDFAEAKSWDDTSLRHFLSVEAAKNQRDTCENSRSEMLSMFHDFHLPWRLLQIVATSEVYEKRTAYNLFALLRIGNEYSHTDPVSSSQAQPSWVLLISYVGFLAYLWPNERPSLWRC